MKNILTTLKDFYAWIKFFPKRNDYDWKNYKLVAEIKTLTLKKFELNFDEPETKTLVEWFKTQPQIIERYPITENIKNIKMTEKEFRDYIRQRHDENCRNELINYGKTLASR